MRTRKYVKQLSAVCPHCGKQVVLDHPDFDPAAEPDPCRHLVGWYNAVVTDWIYARKGVRLPDEDDLETTKDFRVILYVGPYLGGCQYAMDYFVFKKK